MNSTPDQEPLTPEPEKAEEIEINEADILRAEDKVAKAWAKYREMDRRDRMGPPRQ